MFTIYEHQMHLTSIEVLVNVRWGHSSLKRSMLIPDIQGGSYAPGNAISRSTRQNIEKLLGVCPKGQALVMPVKHSMVGVLHEQGRLCCILVKGDVVGAEGMP